MENPLDEPEMVSTYIEVDTMAFGGCVKETCWPDGYVYSRSRLRASAVTASTTNASSRTRSGSKRSK